MPVTWLGLDVVGLDVGRRRILQVDACVSIRLGVVGLVSGHGLAFRITTWGLVTRPPGTWSASGFATEGHWARRLCVAELPGGAE